MVLKVNVSGQQQNRHYYKNLNCYPLNQPLPIRVRRRKRMMMRKRTRKKMKKKMIGKMIMLLLFVNIQQF